MDFESDLLQLRGAIREAEAEAARERSDADTVAASMRDSGADITAPDNFAKIDEAYKRSDAARDKVADLRARQSRLLEIAGGQREPESKREAQMAATFADRLLRSAEYERLRGSGVLQSAGGRVNLDPVEIATRDEFLANGLRLRTTFDNSSGVGSGLLTPDYTGKLVEQLVRRVRLLDVVTVGSTDTDTVDYVTEGTRTDSAAETAYGTAVPESAYGFSHAQTTVKRAGHFVPATKGILADAGQTRTLLTSRLESGLLRRIETQMFSGNGTGENLTGFSGNGSLGSIALGTDTRLDAVHKAITNVRVNSQLNLEPTVLLIHPNDYEQVVLQADSQGRYQIGNPIADSMPTVWGLLPVVTTLATENTVYVGDFKEACTLWVRSGVTISASDSHSDFFLKGLVALMAETRVAFATTRPAAICKITGF